MTHHKTSINRLRMVQPITRKKRPKRILKKGEVVKCPPNAPHWHGASREDALIQIAITSTEKGTTVWLEKVTDEEYND